MWREREQRDARQLGRTWEPHKLLRKVRKPHASGCRERVHQEGQINGGRRGDCNGHLNRRSCTDQLGCHEDSLCAAREKSDGEIEKQ